MLLIFYLKIRYSFKKIFTNRESFFPAKYTFFVDRGSLIFAKWALEGHLRKLVYKILRVLTSRMFFPIK